MAELAVTVADELGDEGPAEERWLYQLRAYAWASLGNALRVQGDLRRADEAFVLSEQWFGAGEEGIGEALGYGPTILDMMASLRSDQRRFGEALDLVDRAFAGYFWGDPDHQDRHLAGRVLIQKGCILTEAGDPEGAIIALREAERLVNPARDPRLFYCLRHNLVDNLGRTGRYGEAEGLLLEVWAWCRDAGTALDAVRLRWSEARIIAGLGRVEEARQSLEEVRREFTNQRMIYDVALVTLELAAFYLSEGRTAEVREMAREVIDVFQAQDVHREALAALAVFHSAAVLDRATIELAREVMERLERTRRVGDPGAR